MRKWPIVPMADRFLMRCEYGDNAKSTIQTERCVFGLRKRDENNNETLVCNFSFTIIIWTTLQIDA